MYADRNVRDFEFIDGEQIHQKVSPMRGVKRFGKRGKLSPRYTGPLEILCHLGVVAYELALPTGRLGIHPVFYVSMLKRYHSDGTYIIRWDLLLLDENQSDEEEPIAILERQVKKSKSKEIASVKVQ
ncbi:uncharacterized protein LOC132045579 [Lycium ferocissimum]|uniref:uncharacterized protein LOC132045579 n=1 Tax=Lycium ferocissimum TaxID=112874 RepID=UPI0028154463|nr:uncharacterized protein LOC132045579 [Lycium ferocissimum]